jgi:uncharacterized protein (TIGR02147 family)
MREMNEISNYTNYKLFLKDYYNLKVETKHGFSFSVWAKSLGIASPSTLSMVINGSRHPSKSLVKKLSCNLKLNSEQTEYFNGLIQLHKSRENPHLTVHLKTQESTVTDSDNFLAISTFVIRELLNNKNLDDPIQFIKENLKYKLTTKQITEKYKFLINKSLIKIDGAHHQATGNIFEEVIANKDGVNNFHKSTMKTISDAFEVCEIEERAFHTSILSVNKDKVQEAKELLKEFQHRMTELLEDNDGKPGDQIYLLNMNLLPASDQTQEKILH